VAINKYLAELVGTFLFLSVAYMTLLGANALGAPPVLIAPLGIGLALLAAIYAVGHVSGAHFNPAVTLAVFLDRRISGADLVGYWLAQFVGALLAALALLAVTNRGVVAATANISRDIKLSLLVELVLTTVFVLVFLAATRTSAATAGIAIALTLAGVHFAGMPFTGTSVNPARSFAPAVVGGQMGDLWLFMVVPLAAAVVAWGLWQLFQPGAEEMVVDIEVEDTQPTEPSPLPEPGSAPAAPDGEMPPPS
jgi:aquaporin Z